ncbi:MAG: DUF3667 domain-containing protein, partial [Maricaulaceae bacterium]
MHPDIDDTGFSHIAPLENDTIPNQNQSHYCFSCSEPNTGLFCAACGQKNDDYRRSIASLFVEVFTSITALEGKIWRTWRSLLASPGQVAREYANGRRNHWSSPIRIYLAMSILLFGLINAFNIQLISFDLDAIPKEGVIKETQDYTAEDLKLDIKFNFFEPLREINKRNETRNFDLLRIELNQPRKAREIGNQANNVTNTYSPEISTNTASPILEPSTTSPQKNSEGNEISIDTDDLGERIAQNADLIQKFLVHPEIINSGFSLHLPRIMFLMMPFSMLVGIIFIRGRENALMYDHLVHAAYIHAVSFLFVFVGVIFSQIAPSPNVAKILFIALLLYLPISLKQMFGRGWVKTIWT